MSLRLTCNIGPEGHVRMTPLHWHKLPRLERGHGRLADGAGSVNSQANAPIYKTDASLRSGMDGPVLHDRMADRAGSPMLG